MARWGGPHFFLFTLRGASSCSESFASGQQTGQQALPGIREDPEATQRGPHTPEQRDLTGSSSPLSSVLGAPGCARLCALQCPLISSYRGSRNQEVRV